MENLFWCVLESRNKAMELDAGADGCTGKLENGRCGTDFSGHCDLARPDSRMCWRKIRSFVRGRPIVRDKAVSGRGGGAERRS